MKNTIIIIISIILVFCFSACQKEDCIIKDKADQSIVCTTDFDPVCGCDGNTYSNSCNAEAVGITSYRNGRCL